MAGSKSNFLLRVLTAVIGIPIVVAILTIGGVEGSAFFAWVISTLMLLEFCLIVLGKVAVSEIVLILIANTVFHLMSLWVGQTFFGLPLVMSGFFFFFLMTLVAVHYSTEHKPTEQLSRHLMASFFGWIYCGVLPLFVPVIRAQENGSFWIILMFVLVWATDIGGYIFGKTIGKHGLYPEVSPKKTWEGAIGGIVLSWIVCAVAKHFFMNSMNWFDVIGLTLAISVFAQVGDLCESVIKRSFDVKDSGAILPGHGGFLDRFDGVLFALPIMYAFLRLFQMT